MKILNELDKPNDIEEEYDKLDKELQESNTLSDQKDILLKFYNNLSVNVNELYKRGYNIKMATFEKENERLKSLKDKNIDLLNVVLIGVLLSEMLTAVSDGKDLFILFLSVLGLSIIYESNKNTKKNNENSKNRMKSYKKTYSIHQYENEIIKKIIEKVGIKNISNRELFIINNDRPNGIKIVIK